MRADADVQNRIRALVIQELDCRIKEASSRLPHLCVHNYRHPLDDRKIVDGDPNESYNRITIDAGIPVSRVLGLCMQGQSNPEEWGGNICEDPVDAQRCPLFEPVRTKSNILIEFDEQLNTPGWVEDNLPAVAALLWVMGKMIPTPLPWWKRFWYHWILRIRVEPVQQVPSIDLILLAETNDQSPGA